MYCCSCHLKTQQKDAPIRRTLETLARMYMFRAGFILLSAFWFDTGWNKNLPFPDSNTKAADSHNKSADSHNKSPHRWVNYTDYLLRALVSPHLNHCGYHCVSLVDCANQMDCMMLLFNKMAEPTNAGHILHMPLGSIHFTSWQFTSHQWKIQVHKHFVINVTVSVSYTPFTDDCSPHNVAIYNGHENSSEVLRNRFCGVIQHESVYTTQNMGLLQIQTFTSLLSFPVHLSARYEILAPHVAFTYNTSTMPLRFIHSNIRPTIVSLSRGTMLYHWYISNIVMKYQHSVVQFVNITVQSCLSTKGSASISIFPGLLTYYWMKWKVVAQTTLQCNLHDTHTIVTDFHLYTTVQLVHDSADQVVAVNMSFLYGSDDMVRHFEHTGYLHMHSRVRQTGSILQYIQTHPDFSWLTLLRFGYFGKRSTFNQGDSNTFDSDGNASKITFTAGMF